MTSRGETAPSLRDLWSRLDRRSATVLLAVTLLGILFRYFGSKPFYFRHLASSYAVGGNPELTAGLYHFGSAFVLFGLIPALIVTLVFREPLADWGVRAGDLSWGWKAFAVATPVMVALSFFASKDPEFLAEYPLNRAAGDGPLAFALHAAAYLFFYAGWEFGFRGFVQFGLRDRLGDGNAILVQVLASSLLHVGKPFGETLGAVLGGVVWGVVAFRTRSLLVPLATHWLLGLSLDYFIVSR
ncbi:MAG: CPBP family intramembrane metalloprotease [Holophagales bacterium]|nr:CPBP family intramembrane metalloprotease [Holophagales bacterium]MBK9964061.1 CPBP family intramembrane metalloprotease [Holophagales bacterium]